MRQDVLPTEVCAGLVKVGFLPCPIDSTGIFLRPLISHGSADALITSVQLLHLLYGVRSLQDLWGRGSCGPLPRCGSVYMVHIEDPAVAVNPCLPV